jgi:hypothetical protein
MNCPKCGFFAKGNECGACGTRIKDVVDKRKDDDKIYFERRKIFLAKNPQCAVFPEKKSCEVHHKKGRGIFYLDESTWLPVSKAGHTEINNYPEWAERMGFKIKRSV